MRCCRRPAPSSTTASAPRPAHYRALGRQRLSRRRQVGRPQARRRSRAASTSCCRCRRSTPARRSSASSPTRARSRRISTIARWRSIPTRAKRELYDIDLSSLEDPLLERLLGEKRREIDQQLTMLATRNTPAFRPASTMLYGSVEPALARRCARPARIDRARRRRAATSIGAAEIADGRARR